MQAFFEQAELFSTIFAKERITFAPLPGKDFIDRVKAAEVGTAINFNNAIGLVCIKKEGDSLTFKKQFEGSLKNMTVDSFRSSETFTVDNASLKDIHYLYGRAYDARTSSAPLRLTLEQSSGRESRILAENSTNASTTKEFSIGPITLHVLKDSDNRCVWYDGNGVQLDTDLVDTIYGWAGNIIPEFTIKEALLPDCSAMIELQDFEFNEWLLLTNRLAFSGQCDKIPMLGFQYAKANGGTLVLTMDSLEPDNAGNYLPTTYAFTCEEGRNHIIELGYKDNAFSVYPEKKRDVSVEEFGLICEKHFTKTCELVVDEKQVEIELMQKNGMSRAQAIAELLKQVMSEGDRDFLGITKQQIDEATKNAISLLSNMDSEGMSVKEFFGNDEHEEKE